jgi:hypothetical protein
MGQLCLKSCWSPYGLCPKHLGQMYDDSEESSEHSHRDSSSSNEIEADYFE